jgi:hypothetical protein
MPDYKVMLVDGTELDGNIKYLVAETTTKVFEDRYRRGHRTPLQAAELYEEVIKYVMPDDESHQDLRSIIKKGTFSPYMTSTVKHPDYNIIKVSKGYLLKKSIEENDDGIDQETSELVKRKTQYKMLERKSYRAVGEFFNQVEGLRSIITANIKTPKATKYTVMDILLCDCRPGYSSYADIELIAVEIKHSRKATTIESMLQTANYISNYGASLLLYPVAKSDKEKVDPKLIDLHYQLGVGLGFIIMDDEVYDDYFEGKIDEIELEDIDVDIPYKPRRSWIPANQKFDSFQLIGQTLYDINDWNGIWAKKN